ncbi:hypothetical protein DFH09DRAFT_1085437 [Mycena vulgaris]|nr:hypothetical protein DFH09DRAFT_1085437 [Mycena vulgaris]
MRFGSRKQAPHPPFVVYGIVDFHRLRSFLWHSQRDYGLVSFQLIFSSVRSFDTEIYAAGHNVIAGQLAWMTAGMDIYIGSEDTNYAALDGCLGTNERLDATKQCILGAGSERWLDIFLDGVAMKTFSVHTVDIGVLSAYA